MRAKLAVGGLTIAVAFLIVTNPVVVDAAGKITSKQIKDNSVKNKDIKDETLTGTDVQNNTLTGDDINETSLVGTNAATLNGLAPAAFQTSVIRVPVAATASTSSFVKSLPPTIPNGTYLVSININANLSAGGVGFFCSLYTDPPVGNALMASFGSNYGNGGASTINASKVVTVSGPLAVFCASGGGTFSTPISIYNPSEITFTKVDTVTTTGPVARGTEGSGSPGSVPRP